MLENILKVTFFKKKAYLKSFTANCSVWTSYLTQCTHETENDLPVFLQSLLYQINYFIIVMVRP